MVIPSAMVIPSTIVILSEAKDLLVPLCHPGLDPGSSVLLVFSVVGAASHAARPLCTPAISWRCPFPGGLCRRHEMPPLQLRRGHWLQIFAAAPSHGATSGRLRARLRPSPELYVEARLSERSACPEQRACPEYALSFAKGLSKERICFSPSVILAFSFCHPRHPPLLSSSTLVIEDPGSFPSFVAAPSHGAIFFVILSNAPVLSTP